jgi:hypothetical protein
MALSMLALGVLVFLERRMAKSRWGSLIDKLLEPYKKQSLLVMRIGIAATLLLAWNEDAMLMPERHIPQAAHRVVAIVRRARRMYRS